MKMVIIGAVAILALAGIGAGAYFYFMQPAQASAGKEAEKTAEAAKKDAEKAEAPVFFVQLDPLILPVVDDGGFTQVVSLVVSIEVPDEGAKDKVKSLAPRLTDAFIQDMYGEISQESALKGGIVQVGVIKKRLNKIAIDVLGKDSVHDVLLQVVQQRPA